MIHDKARLGYGNTTVFHAIITENKLAVYMDEWISHKS